MTFYDYICNRMINIPIESLNLMTLNLGFARHHADWNWQNVSSPFTRIFLVTEGRAWLHLPQGKVELRPGCAYIVPAHTIHSYQCDGDFALYYLHVHEGFKNVTDVFELYEFPSEVEVDATYESLFALACRANPDAGLPASNPISYDNDSHFHDYVGKYSSLPLHERMALRGFTLMLVARFLAEARPRLWTKDERIMRIIQYIGEHINQRIDMEELATFACVSKSYFIRLFTSALGISPIRYINRKKIERARLLLMTEHLSVKEAAFRLGFDDHSYFIRLFKRTTGLTPKDYRRRFGHKS